MKIVWICEICEKYYHEQSGAIECEKKHCHLAFRNFGEKITELAKRIYVLGRSATTVEEKLVVLSKGLTDASKKE